MLSTMFYFSWNPIIKYSCSSWWKYLMCEIFAILILYYIKLHKFVTTVSNFEEIDYFKNSQKTDDMYDNNM